MRAVMKTIQCWADASRVGRSVSRAFTSTLTKLDLMSILERAESTLTNWTSSSKYLSIHSLSNCQVFSACSGCSDESRLDIPSRFLQLLRFEAVGPFHQSIRTREGLDSWPASLLFQGSLGGSRNIGRTFARLLSSMCLAFACHRPRSPPRTRLLWVIAFRHNLLSKLAEVSTTRSAPVILKYCLLHGGCCFESCICADDSFIRRSPRRFSSAL